MFLKLNFFFLLFRENISQSFLRHNFRSKRTIPTTVVLRRLEACAVLRIHGIGGLLSITTPLISTHFYGHFCNTACALLIYILHGLRVNRPSIHINRLSALKSWAKSSCLYKVSKKIWFTEIGLVDFEKNFSDRFFFYVKIFLSIIEILP